MFSRLLVLPGLFALSGLPISCPADIFKCVSSTGEIEFQQWPCEQDQNEVVIDEVAIEADSNPYEPAKIESMRDPVRPAGPRVLIGPRVDESKCSEARSELKRLAGSRYGRSPGGVSKRLKARALSTRAVMRHCR
jgi:hypothetical protein